MLRVIICGTQILAITNNCLTGLKIHTAGTSLCLVLKASLSFHFHFKWGHGYHRSFHYSHFARTSLIPYLITLFSLWHSFWQIQGDSLLWFLFAFPWWLVMLNIISIFLLTTVSVFQKCLFSSLDSYKLFYAIEFLVYFRCHLHVTNTVCKQFLNCKIYNIILLVIFLVMYKCFSLTYLIYMFSALFFAFSSVPKSKKLPISL